MSNPHSLNTSQDLNLNNNNINTSLDDSTNTSPQIDPNYKPPTQTALPFVIYEKGKFIIPTEAKNLLSNVQSKNIGIISLVGKYRTGKSFLLNRVILNRQNNNGFNVGPTFKPCTKGIWIWSDPLMINNLHCKETFPTFLIDTEGLGAYDEEVNHDSKIFLIAILISSLFIFNSFGTIDENAISSLSFVLNLSKTIKLKNNQIGENNENELAEYFPTLLWLLRDFHLKLEDNDGNKINEKQYLETALRNVNGTSETIIEKNRVRTLLRTYFPERDAFVMVRPVERESDLQNLQNLPDSKLRPEFLVQSANFRKKVFDKIRPKIFMKKNLTGFMLVELVQSILDSINGGAIPVIENSWKYIIQNECIKNVDEYFNNFKEDLRKFQEENKNNKNYIKDVKIFTKKLFDSYIEKFNNNNFIDEDVKKTFCEKLKNKLKNELDNFNKENQILFQRIFSNELDILYDNFIKNLEKSDNKYNNKNYYQFFNDLDNFKDEAEKLSPDFPAKKEILYDKIMLIFRKFIETQFLKNRFNFENEINNYKNNINILTEKLKQSNDELIKYKQNYTEEINNLNSELVNEKMKEKNYEDKINTLLNEKKISKEHFETQIENIKNDYQNQIKNLMSNKNKLETDLHLKEEQLLVLKMNNEKINNLHEQKFNFLEKEIQNWKDKFNNLNKNSNNKENSLKDEISLLKAQNQSLKLENSKNTNNDYLNQNLNNLMKYFKDNLKAHNEENKNFIIEMMNNQNTEKKNDLMKNLNEISEKNSELNLQLNNKEIKIKSLEEQNNKLNLYKDIIHNAKEFKCKKCNKNFSFENFKEHYNSCNYDKNLLNNNNNVEFYPEKLKIKILKGKVKIDEIGKPYLDYIIDINYSGQNWRINKKFNQFANLYKTIKSLFKGSVNMPQSSNIFININEMTNGNFHENKIYHLEKFIKDLAELEGVNTSKPFRKFLEFDNNFDDENDGFNNNNNFNNSQININNINFNNNNNNMNKSDYLVMDNNYHNNYYNNENMENNYENNNNNLFRSNL